MKPFKNFDEALNKLPRCITGLDLMGQHHTISDLEFLVQFQLDLFGEGEAERDIHTARQLAQCIAYRERCKVSTEASSGPVEVASIQEYGLDQKLSNSVRCF